MGRVNDGQFGAVCPQCGSAAAVHSIGELATLARNQLGQPQGNGPAPAPGDNPPAPGYDLPPGFNPPPGGFGPPPPPGYQGPPPPGYTGSARPGQPSQSGPSSPSGQAARPMDWAGLGDAASAP